MPKEKDRSVILSRQCLALGIKPFACVLGVFQPPGPVFFSSRTEINGPVPGQSVKVDIDIVCETKYFVGLNFAVSASGISVNYPPVKHE